MTASEDESHAMEMDLETKLDPDQSAKVLPSTGGQKSSNQNFYSCLSDVSMSDEAQVAPPPPPIRPPTEKISGDVLGGGKSAPALGGIMTPLGKNLSRKPAGSLDVTPPRRLWGDICDEPDDTPVIDLVGEAYHVVEGGGDVTPAFNATKSPRGKKNFEEKKKFESVTPSVSTPQIVASFDEDLKVAPAFGSDGSNFDPEIFSRGSKKSSPEKKKRALLGVTCISEMSNDGTVLVWAENSLFYRLRSDDFTRVPKPLTPIFFETDGDLHSRKISKSSDIPTYVGTFQRFPDEKKESFSLSGVFIHDDRSVTFECNPGAAFARPIKSSFFKDQLHVTVLKSLKFNVRCEAKFATSGQSLLKNRSPSAFPSSVSGFAPPPSNGLPSLTRWVAPSPRKCLWTSGSKPSLKSTSSSASRKTTSFLRCPTRTSSTSKITGL